MHEGRTIPPYEYRWGSIDEALPDRLGRLFENTLRALVEVIQVAAERGSDAAVEWVMEHLDATDTAQPEDWEAYARWHARGGAAPDWHAMAETAKAARQLGQRLREGKPISFGHPTRPGGEHGES